MYLQQKINIKKSGYKCDRDVVQISSPIFTQLIFLRGDKKSHDK